MKDMILGGQSIRNAHAATKNKNQWALFQENNSFVLFARPQSVCAVNEARTFISSRQTQISDT